MSLEARTALAQAANTVAGINVAPYYRQSLKSGSGVVMLRRVAYPDDFGGVAHWRVIVALPQDLEAAEKFLDQRLPELVAALHVPMVVTEAAPYDLTTPDGGTVPCVAIDGHRAAEGA